MYNYIKIDINMLQTDVTDVQQFTLTIYQTSRWKRYRKTALKDCYRDDNKQPKTTIESTTTKKLNVMHF